MKFFTSWQEALKEMNKELFFIRYDKNFIIYFLRKTKIS